MTQSLLDIVSTQMNCEYLSDLRSLDSGQRARLVRKLEKIPSGEASLFEWNDALEYLARQPPQETAEAAKERLIQSLSRPRQTGPNRPLDESPTAEIQR